jgi:hypothetical protein
MNAWIWVVIAVVVVLAAIAALALSRARRSERLQRGFGPEYEREIERQGGRREAEAELMQRTKRREALDIRPLSPDARTHYQQSWRDTQSRFVDEPVEAVAEAERSVVEVMQQRGYPMEDFEQRAADVSVDHPHVVENYRAAHTISVRAVAGEASTEDLRQAMVHYRALFDDLLGDDGDREHNGGGRRTAGTETTHEVEQ